MFNLTLLDIGISVRPSVWRNTSWNQINSMTMITNRWEAFGSLKYLGMIVQDFLEIWRNG